MELTAIPLLVKMFKVLKAKPPAFECHGAVSAHALSKSLTVSVP